MINEQSVTFQNTSTVKDEWEAGNDHYRLIDCGVGPLQLQIFKNLVWAEESVQYRWGVLTNRIEYLLRVK